jgi:hypothetical protein
MVSITMLDGKAYDWAISRFNPHIKYDSPVFKTMQQEIKEINDHSSAFTFMHGLSDNKKFEAIYLLFVHDFDNMNRVLELLGHDEGKKFMLYITSREFLVTKETTEAFHRQRKIFFHEWMLKNDPVYRAVRSMTHYVPGCSNPYDN